MRLVPLTESVYGRCMRGAGDVKSVKQLKEANCAYTVTSFTISLCVGVIHSLQIELLTCLPPFIAQR